MGNKKPKKDFSQSAGKDVWERKWQQDPRYPSRVIKRELCNEFAKVAMADIKRQNVKRVLELGPGAGRDTATFVENGFDVVAVEISKSGADRIRNDFPTALVLQSDIREAELPPQLKVDAIYAFSVLHYFTDDELKKIYENLSSHLNENGRIYLALRSVNDEMYGKGQKVDEDTFVFNDAKRRFFSSASISEQLTKNGFDVIAVDDRTVDYHAHDDGHKSTFLEVIAKKKGVPKFG